MTKKVFCTKSQYISGKKPVIDFSLFNPGDNTEARHRLDFDLGSIEDVAIRGLVGAAIAQNLPKVVAKISALLESPVIPLEAARISNLKDAFCAGVLIKHTAAQSPNTQSDYDVVKNEFLKWLEKEGLNAIPVTDFTRALARGYWAYLSKRKTSKGTLLAARTLNNKLIYLRAVFAQLLEEKIIQGNPFKAIKVLPEAEKDRRNFTAAEAAIVSEYIQENNYWLYIALLLQYYCYIRPVELTRLRFRDFDLSAGTVSVQVNKGKKRRRIATIPQAILHYFREPKFMHNNSFFVFGVVEYGKQYRVSPSIKACGEDRLYKQHRKVLEKLKTLGKIKDINGLTWYSWKDTGISVHAHHTTPMSTRDQAGHTDFGITLKYYHAPEVNEQYRSLPDTLSRV